MMDKLLLGIKGHAVCLDKHTGNKIWSTKLKATSGVTNMFVDGDLVFAYSGGHLFCLDIHSGDIKWENKLEGMGYGPCIIGTEVQNVSAVTAHSAAQQASAACTTAVVGASVSQGSS
ncbi:outer membrane protein assembly factor BamB family protein [Pseudoalteromonas sp. A25]|uniref:outer membrane protein assembly factor BamB family protein n=1 Tax=Pseudoalteromonas sp. A25 TaxID=116092 RepID=UPI001E54DC40|nr:PQQ-binding-like beta-propeller repeat protein [Pseudoalteromonas sp. A25]